MSASCFCAASRALRAAISASSALATIVGGASTTLLSLGAWDDVLPDAASSPDVVPVPVFLAHPPKTSIPTSPATAIKYSDLLLLLIMGIFPFLSLLNECPFAATMCRGALPLPSNHGSDHAGSSLNAPLAVNRSSPVPSAL